MAVEVVFVGLSREADEAIDLHREPMPPVDGCITQREALESHMRIIAGVLQNAGVNNLDVGYEIRLAGDSEVQEDRG